MVRGFCHMWGDCYGVTVVYELWGDCCHMWGDFYGATVMVRVLWCGCYHTCMWGDWHGATATYIWGGCYGVWLLSYVW